MKVIRVILSLFLIFALIVTPLGLFKYEPKTAKSDEYKCVLTVWQIDGFEGGTGSRRQFLYNSARDFEKQNTGVFVLVQSKTVFDAENSMLSGEYPDMISYCNGVNVKDLKEINCDSSFSGGQLKERTFAVPWCRGGYVLILNPQLKSEFPNEIENIVISENDYTLPLTALYLDGYKIKNYEIMQPLDAYVKFTNGKTPYFLGTQRDLIRLSNRGMEVKIKPIQNFNNLYQYVSIITNDKVKNGYSQDFINYLLEESRQQSLSKIGMLSQFYNVESSVFNLNEMNNIKFSTTVSAFTGLNNINVIKDLTNKSIKGDEEAKIKLKNMLIST